MTQLPGLLAALDARPLGPYTLRLADVRPAGKSGWLFFRLLLTSSDAAFQAPVLEGIFSTGGRGVAPWFEITRYYPRLQFAHGGRPVGLAAEALDRKLFGYLSDLVPPGGHLMLACESPEHETTYRLLMLRVPPLLTPLGHLLFDCDFRSVRFFYLAEGGCEGQQKLWAEKALNPDTARRWTETSTRDILRFLAEPENARFAPACAGAVLAVLKAIGTAGPLGALVCLVLQECGAQAGQNPGALFECARHLLGRSPSEWQ